MALALEMTWERIASKRRNYAPLGLRNLGNTCYLNSVLQCLTYTPPLAHFCLLQKHSASCNSMTSGNGSSPCPFCLLEKRILRSLNLECSVDSPMMIHNSLQIFAKEFKRGRQEDAHEFLGHVINACEEVCIKAEEQMAKLKQRRDVKNEACTIMKDIFFGVLQSQIKCLSCGGESNNFDNIKELNLSVQHVDSVTDAFLDYFKPEKLDGNNMYTCQKCKKQCPARMQLSIMQAPNVLVVELKRFENNYGYGGKIDRYINFEEQLSLSSYMCKTAQDSMPEYTLFGAIVHQGISQDSGHYYAYVKHPNGKWYCCDDNQVLPVPVSEVLSEKVYILFYIRQSQRLKGKDNSFCNGAMTPTVYSDRSNVSDSNNGSVNNDDTEKHSRHDNYGRKSSEKCRRDLSHSNGVTGPRKATADQRTSSVHSCRFDGKLEHSSESSTISGSFAEEPSDQRYGNKMRSDLARSVNREERISPRTDSEKMSNCSSYANGSVPFFSVTKQSNGTSLSNGNHGSAERIVVGKRKREDNESINPSTVLTIDNKKLAIEKEKMSNCSSYANGSGSFSSVTKQSSGHSLLNGHHGSAERIVVHKRKREEDNDSVNPSTVFTIDTSELAIEKEKSEENPLESEKFKQELCLDLREMLHSSGWVNDVRQIMRDRKRICDDERRLSDSPSVSKASLIQDVSGWGVQHLPDFVKNSLIERMRSVFK